MLYRFLVRIFLISMLFLKGEYSATLYANINQSIESKGFLKEKEPKQKEYLLRQSVDLDLRMYVEDLKVQNNNIYIALLTYDGENRDGYRSEGFLSKYSTDLKKEWTLRIHETYTNEIHKITIHNNRIYALVKRGESSKKLKSTYYELYTIDMNGQVLDKVFIGYTYHRSTELVVEGDKLYFAYSTCTDKDCNYGATKFPVIVQYDLKTKAVKQRKIDLVETFNETIYVKNGEVTIMGRLTISSRKTGGTFSHILSTDMNSSDEVVRDYYAMTEGDLYYLHGFKQGKEMTVLNTFPGTYYMKDKYLKFIHVNTDTKEENINVIRYAPLGWDDLSFTIWGDEQSVYLYIRDFSNEFWLVRMDYKGNILSKYPMEKKSDWVNKFCFDKEELITSDGHTIKKYSLQ